MRLAHGHLHGLHVDVLGLLHTGGGDGDIDIVVVLMGGVMVVIMVILLQLSL